MAIIITKMIDVVGSGGNIVKEFPDFAIVHETFCYDHDDQSFATIGLGGGTEITKAELKVRALDVHTRYPFNNIDDSNGNPPTLTEKTNAEVETMVDDWCTEKNAS